MKLTVLGASGRIGGELVQQGLAAGHHVTAVVRAGSTSGFEPHQSLEVAVADVMDADALGPVVAGRDAVLSALGPRPSGPTSVLSDGAASVIEASRATGVRRFLVVSVAGIHTTGDDPFTRCVVKPILGRFLRDSFADARRMEELVRESDLDWTIVCPPRLINGAAKARIRSNTSGTVRGGFSITRADVATYLLRAVDDDAVLRRTAVIAN